MQIIQDKWSFHFWNGIKYNYPLCCILYFCNVQTNYGDQKDSLYERIMREAYDTMTVKWKGDNHGRTLCPNCLFKFYSQPDKSIEVSGNKNSQALQEKGN